MRVRVVYFASCRELAGVSEEEFALVGGATLGALLDIVRGRHGPLEEGGRLLAAVNSEFAGPEARLAEGDVVALFPPVSGG